MGYSLYFLLIFEAVIILIYLYLKKKILKLTLKEFRRIHILTGEELRP